ncbi:hypothetical protein EYC84_003596 [Monilinia fructicola]|uniref:Uncharacterized protein n=1 Tax=Monilinia fructicola TaxID=38448 RepID=A0A5M9JV25_MONFR|nr:hypothetical protein EYC84_003596 [Monilinia fructicola]
MNEAKPSEFFPIFRQSDHQIVTNPPADDIPPPFHFSVENEERYIPYSRFTHLPPNPSPWHQPRKPPAKEERGKAKMMPAMRRKRKLKAHSKSTCDIYLCVSPDILISSDVSEYFARDGMGPHGTGC